MHVKTLTMNKLNAMLHCSKYERQRYQQRLSVSHLKERSITVITSPCFRRSDCCNTSPFTEVGLTELRFVKITWRGNKHNAAQNRSSKRWSLILIDKTPNAYYYLTSKINKLFKQKIILTSLFSFKSILQCSLETWGSWMRISHPGFLCHHKTRRVRKKESPGKMLQSSQKVNKQSIFNIIV